MSTVDRDLAIGIQGIQYKSFQLWRQNFCDVILRIKYWSPSCADLRINSIFDILWWSVITPCSDNLHLEIKHLSSNLKVPPIGYRDKSFFVKDTPHKSYNFRSFSNQSITLFIWTNLRSQTLTLPCLEVPVTRQFTPSVHRLYTKHTIIYSFIHSFIHSSFHPFSRQFTPSVHSLFILSSSVSFLLSAVH